MTGQEIAIIGLSCRFPGADTIEEFWRNLCEGRDSVTRFHDASGGYSGAAGILAGADTFDAAFFGYSPREAELMDPQHRVFLECAWQALENAGYGGPRRPRTGVYAGAAMNTYLLENVYPARPPATEGDRLELLIGSDKDFLASRVSYKLDLRGPAVVVQGACASSLVAVHLASQALLGGDCDLALAGGVTVRCPLGRPHAHEPGLIFSADGYTRAFDWHATGSVPGSGCGIVALRRLEDARRDGDCIRAVILGSAINNDGASKAGYAAPSPAAQSEVIRTALRAAGVDRASIGYIEAHGSGTLLGDSVEIAGLKAAFGDTPGIACCGIGSVKPNIGHLDAAAGVAGLIKTVLSLERGWIPPSLHFDAPNPESGMEGSRFFVNGQLREWTGLRRAGVSSFGLGGVNAHVVLEQAPDARPADAGGAAQVIALSARSPAALAEMRGELAEALRNSDVSLADASFTLAAGRREFPYRWAAVVERGDNLAAAAGNEEEQPVSPPAGAAWLLPGLGEQFRGMGEAVYRSERIYRAVADDCCALLEREFNSQEVANWLTTGREPSGGGGLRALVAGGSGPAGGAPDWAGQAALFVNEYALARQWMHWGVKPRALGGYSLGEIAAACLAGVLEWEDALRLIVLRGKWTAECAPPGGLLAIASGKAEARQLLREGVWVAAVNGPETTVLGGAEDAVSAVEAECAAQGVAARRLRVQRAYHTPHVRQAAERAGEWLSRVRLRAPEIPYISNLTGDWITPEQAQDPACWVRQMIEPVRFDEALGRLIRVSGITLEVGPGRSLSALALQHPAAAGSQAITCVASLPGWRDGEDELRGLRGAVARLWTRGAGIDWAAFYEGQPRRRVPLPVHPLERKRHWIGPPRADAGPPETKAIEDWFYVPGWKRSTARPNARTVPGPVLIFAEPGTVLPASIPPTALMVYPGKRMERRGANEFTIDPQRPEQYGQLLAAADYPEWIVCAWTEFWSVVRLLQAISAAGRRCRIALVAEGVHEIESQDRWSPEKAMAAALPEVVRAELGGTVECLHIEAGSLARENWWSELASDEREPLISVRGPKHRYVRAFEPLRLGAAPAGQGFRAGAVYLLQGGMGQIGLHLARELTKRGAKAALTGRRRSKGARELESSGVEVLAIQADAADEAQTRAAFEAARARFGGVDFVLHLASARAAPERLDELAPEKSAGLFRAKCDALPVLKRVLNDYPRTRCAVFSSTAAQFGGVGLGDYAAASAYAGSFALQCAREGLPWVSINWDGWWTETAAMPSREIARHFLTGGEALEALERVLAHSLSGQVMVSRRPVAERVSAPAQPVVRNPDLSVRWAPGSYVQPASELERSLAGIWQNVLRVPEIGADDSFFHLGGDSLLGTKLAGAIRAAFRIEVSLKQLWTHPTVRQMAALVEETIVDELLREDEGPAAEAASTATANGTLRLSALAEDLNALTGAYVKAALGSMAAASGVAPPFDARTLQERCGIAAEHRKLLVRWLDLFGQPNGDKAGAHALEARVLARTAGSAYEPIARALCEIGRDLPEMLSGSKSAVEVFFRGGSSATVDSAYGAIPEAHEALEGMRRLLRRVIDVTDGRPLEVIEVGGGAGAATNVLLPALPPGSRYLFTDVSPYFFELARARFPGVECALYDIDAPSGAAGFDLVVAANVLHCARHLRWSLASLASRLSPAGHALILETTRSQPWHTLAMGLLKGFHAYEDERLRSNEPFLNRHAWLQLMQEAGLAPIAVEPAEEALETDSGQCVFLAGRA